VWANHHDITEGQIVVLTIDPAPLGTEPQGLVFWIIPLGSIDHGIPSANGESR
jgi:hypothetical protein